MFCRKRRCCRCMNRSVGDITYEELKRKQQEGATIVDVRSRQEYEEGHLNGAISFPEYEINQNTIKRFSDKNDNIVLYCQSGARSRSAAMKFNRLGYTNIYILNGGLDML